MSLNYVAPALFPSMAYGNINLLEQIEPFHFRL